VKTSFPPFALRLYQGYECLLNALQSALLLAVRLIWGGQFIQTGWGKWHDLPKVTAYFTDLGLPFPELNACLVATTELVCGLFLLLGLFGRLAPVPLIIAMGVAYVTTEQEAFAALATGDLDPFLTAAPFLFLFASLLILVFGPGRFSVDHLILSRWSKQENTTSSSQA
jgi:putative oxidoreductase